MSRTAKFVALTVTGLTALGGGLAVAGALPNVSELSGGHSAVDTVPPDAASQTGIDHAQAGGDAGNGGVERDGAGGTVAADIGTTGSDARLDGLTTAAGNVTSDQASAVIETLSSGTPGPGEVGRVASDGRSQVPTSVPPAQVPTNVPPAQVPTNVPPAQLPANVPAQVPPNVPPAQVPPNVPPAHAPGGPQ